MTAKERNKTIIKLRHAEQINGREGETATLLSRCLVSLKLRGGGFAPRHLNRSMPRGIFGEVMIKQILISGFLFCLCFVSANGQAAFVDEGVSIAGITVGESAMSDVVTTHGGEYKLIEHNKYSYEAVYSSGLSFWYCQNDTDKKIFSVLVKPPYYGITGKGIVVGESTVKDILDLYGESRPFTNTYNKTWHYEYGVFRFDVRFDSWDDRDNLELFLQRKVIAIAVKSPNQKGNACK